MQTGSISPHCIGKYGVYDLPARLVNIGRQYNWWITVKKALSESCTDWAGGCFFYYDTYTFWGGHPWGTPPPKPPFQCPTRTKKVPICSFLKQASICILIKTWNWSVAELWGKNWDTDAHAHVTYQAPITGLHSPTLLPFLQNLTDYLMLAQSCKFGVNCCFIALTHPAVCTWSRVPLTFGQVHRPPP